MATKLAERPAVQAKANRRNPRGFWSSGDAGVWLTAGATALCLLLIVGVFGLVVAGGMGFFWPRTLYQFELADGTTLLGQIWEREPVPVEAKGTHPTYRIEIRGANRDLAPEHEYFWVNEADIARRTTPAAALVIERLEYGDAYGMPVAYRTPAGETRGEAESMAALRARRPLVRDLQRQITSIERGLITKINEQLESARLEQKRLGPASAESAALSDRVGRLEERYRSAEVELDSLRARLAGDALVVRTPDGTEHSIAGGAIVRFYAPNELNPIERAQVYADRTWEFVSGTPREANTQGGILPAIFGTVLMVLLMTIAVVPLGVIAALYLREYAKQGALVRLVRIAVNNLAGVPSIVFGIFGLGFFVYFVGGSIDRLFFADTLPTPTFGTGGILWSALTLALLTLPVVIVATEEGLAAVPHATREGSLALGATKWETTWRVVLPAASPGILTGVILAMARAAGEVAPLMLTGAVKIASDLPVSTSFPFLHLERKFMHLGFHIYDVGFQSPNVEAAKPMVYMTTLLLVLLVIVLNVMAMAIRNRLRSRYRSSSF